MCSIIVEEIDQTSKGKYNNLIFDVFFLNIYFT